MSQVIAVSLLVIFVMAGVVSTQSASNGGRKNGMVQGVTRDFLGALVPKAVLLFESGEFKREVISDEVGRFEIKLPAGIYKVTVKKFDIFDRFERKSVKVMAGKTRKLNIVLKYDLKKYPPETLYPANEFNRLPNHLLRRSAG